MGKRFRFSIFSKIHTKNILKEEHVNHPNHLIRFGGGLPEREKLNINTIPWYSKLKRFKSLLSAYGSKVKNTL
jgi:hypothetical protein